MFSLFTAPTLPVFPELPPQLESEAIAVTPSATVSAEQQPVRELEPETPQGNISTGVRACIASTLLTLLTRSKAASHIREWCQIRSVRSVFGGGSGFFP